VNGSPGFYAVYAEKKTSLHLLWVFMEGKMYRMAAASGNEWKETLRQSALSLRRLKPEERDQVRVLRLRFESARAGESLEEFSKRTGGGFKPEMIAVLNNLDGKPLAAGQVLKVARWEPYRPMP
jgi:predicted Zn-dependent protease